MRPLRNTGFRLLVAGQLVSNLGDAVYSVALPWYVLSHHGGPLLLGTVLAAYGVPRTALLLVGGHASDRWQPWTVMMAANGVRAVAVAVLAVVAALGPGHELVLLPIAVVLGAGEGIFLPGSFAIVPALLPTDELQQGNALTSGTTQLSTLAGPVLAGIVIAVAGAPTGFAIDALSFLISMTTLAGIRTQAKRPLGKPSNENDPATEVLASETETSLQQAPAGKLTVRGLIASEPILVLMLATYAVINLGSSGMARVALPALTRGTFHTGAGGYGVLLSAMGAGLLLGTISAATVPHVRRPLVISSLALLIAVPFIAALPYLGGPIQAGVALLVSGALEALGNVLIVTAYQQWAPPELMGRVTGLLMLSSVGILPISVLLAGLAVQIVGPATYFPLAASSVTVAVAVQLTSRTWRNFRGTTVRQPAAAALSQQ